jgi:hypothetical protein
VARNINPNDVNYGGLLALWRLQLVHDTILNANYWGVVCEGILITVLLFYIFWMRKQRAERFRMTVDMVHQLLNSRAFARFHANRVINIHNALVRNLNDEHEGKLRSGDSSDDLNNAPQQLAIPRTITGTIGDDEAAGVDQIRPLADFQESPNPYRGSTIPLVAAAEFGVDSELVSPFAGKRTASVEEVLAQANAAASAVDLPSDPVADEDKDAKIRRLEAQVEAKEQRIRALRNNLNRNRQNEAGTSNDDGMDGAE